MTSKQADKIIRDGKPVTVQNTFWGERFTALFIRRDRYNIYSADGGKYDRSELKVI